MAETRAIFGLVARIEAAPAALDAKRGTAAGVTAYFDGGDSARLTGGDARSAGLLTVLEDARAARVPVYVVLDAATDAVRELRIPLPTDTVVSLTEINTETLDVELQFSAARHVLKRSNPEYGRVRQALEAARERRTSVTVVETDDHEIIDVQETALPFVPELMREAGKALAAPPAMSMADAEKLFASLSGTTCNPKTPVDPCIPFLYPDDGCYARAHEMCRLGGPAKTGKVWIYGNLVVQTRNHPTCKIGWRYHVAPTVNVKSGATTSAYVLDPSLFTKPVTIATWKGVQGDAGAQTAETDSAPFYRAPDGNITKSPSENS